MLWTNYTEPQSARLRLSAWDPLNPLWNWFVWQHGSATWLENRDTSILKDQRLKKNNLDWNFQSRLKISISLENFKILNYFNLWALRDDIQKRRSPARTAASNNPALAIPWTSYRSISDPKWGRERPENWFRPPLKNGGKNGLKMARKWNLGPFFPFSGHFSPVFRWGQNPFSGHFRPHFGPEPPKWICTRSMGLHCKRRVSGRSRLGETQWAQRSKFSISLAISLRSKFSISLEISISTSRFPHTT